MIAIDTNILVYSHRRDFSQHTRARAELTQLAAGKLRWTIVPHCVIEFLANVTNQRIYETPTPVEQALREVTNWIASPAFTPIGETGTYPDTLATLLGQSKVTGATIYDARIAANCLDSGITELWTADRDYGWFPSLKTRNPLV